MAKRKQPGKMLKQAQKAKRGVEAVADAETTTSGFNMPRDLLALLRAVALKRAKEQGGRPSVSAILCDLVEEKRADLEKEAGPWMEMVEKGLI